MYQQPFSSSSRRVKDKFLLGTCFTNLNSISKPSVTFTQPNNYLITKNSHIISFYLSITSFLTLFVYTADTGYSKTFILFVSKRFKCTFSLA